MKCKIPEISWHNRDPVLSVDIQPNKYNGDSLNNYRLASGGTDAHVLIWYMKMTSGKKGDIELDLAADLTRHQRAVNVVKWSPNGELLASGDDESVVFIWKLKSDSEPLNILDTTNEQDKEVWITLKVLRGHMEDIYDLSWAPNSLFLVSGSVDNSAIMWDIAKGKPTSILKDHKGFVQGVAWDPKNQYIATLSTDRYLRIFDIQSKKVLHRISKGTLPVSEESSMHGKSMRLFHDDTLQTFFRRLCFSPDGKLLLTPAGVTDYDGCTHPINTTYAFSRYGFRQPAIVLPCPDQYTVAVSCCPLLFCLRPHDLEKNPPVVPLPYRMIFAVATKSSVYFYDTQQRQPFALISNIHYTRLTDLAWSQDGLVVVVSSTDGFCSLITFEKGELGEVFEDSDAVLEAALAQVNSKNGKSKKQKENDNGAKSRKPSLDGNNHSKENTPVQAETILEKIDESNKETVSAIETTKTANDDEAECGKKQNTLKPNPIAIRRKPAAAASLASDETVLKKIDETNKETASAIDTTKNTNDDDKAEYREKQSTPKANPITIKRKPEGKASSSTSDEAKPIQIKRNSRASSTSPEKSATPIAIKRKSASVGKPDSQPAAPNEKEDQCTTPSKAGKPVITSKVLTGDIILDKEILSSEDKFESPEKKSRAVTPISVRRHPRTPSQTPTQACQSPTSFAKIITSSADNFNNSSSKQTKTPRQEKKATPIAVRRIPRTQISTPTVVNTPNMIEEALDAWPLAKDGEDINKDADADKCNKRPLKETGVDRLPSEETADRTEDMRLVYEDTVEEPPTTEATKSTKHNTFSEKVIKLPASAESKTETIPTSGEKATEYHPDQETANIKTPKRVTLRTISTPKSKKKLMD